MPPPQLVYRCEIRKFARFELEQVSEKREVELIFLVQWIWISKIRCFVIIKKRGCCRIEMFNEIYLRLTRIIFTRITMQLSSESPVSAFQ